MIFRMLTDRIGFGATFVPSEGWIQPRLYLHWFSIPLGRKRAIQKESPWEILKGIRLYDKGNPR